MSIGLPFAPESPWYLVRQDRLDEARSILLSLYGSVDEVNIKLAAMEQTVQEDRLAKESDWVDCFQGTNLIRTLISIGVFACQHLAGIIFVLGYSTYFFQLAGLDTSRSFDLGVGVTACGLAGNLLSWVVVNGYGRRKVFVQGMFTLTALLLLIGIMDVVPTGAAKWVQAACTVIYAFVYFMTIGASKYSAFSFEQYNPLSLRLNLKVWKLEFLEDSFFSFLQLKALSSRLPLLKRLHARLFHSSSFNTHTLTQSLKWHSLSSAKPPPLPSAQKQSA